MFKFSHHLLFIVALLIVTTMGCSDDELPTPPDPSDKWMFNPTPYTFPTPNFFPPPNLPADNPLTKQGIKLGRLLFYDPILSGDSTLSCSGCHQQSNGFSDALKQFSVGIDGLSGSRNSMTLFNLAWDRSFFWDGRSPNLEDQVLRPVEDPVEMHESWANNIVKLSRHPHYPKLFFEAFGEKVLTKEMAAKAMAQFLRTIISANSKYDKFVRGELFITGEEFTDEEERGLELFLKEPALINGGADCFHCHDFSSNLFNNVNLSEPFRNNGLQNATTINDFQDKGRGAITNNPNDFGKFKSPSLRNLAFSAPYMHDGRIQTIDEVIDFYNEAPFSSPNLDPVMNTHRVNGGLNLSSSDKAALKAFLLSLTDESLLTNPDYAKPLGFE